MNWKKLLCKISRHRSDGDSKSMRIGAAWKMRGKCERCGCVLQVKRNITIWEEVSREQLVAEELMKDEADRYGHQYDSGGPQGWQGVQGNMGNQGPTP